MQERSANLLKLAKNHTCVDIFACCNSQETYKNVMLTTLVVKGKGQLIKKTVTADERDVCPSPNEPSTHSCLRGDTTYLTVVESRRGEESEFLPPTAQVC
jgi:hypothetical protein